MRPATRRGPSEMTSRRDLLIGFGSILGLAACQRAGGSASNAATNSAAAGPAPLSAQAAQFLEQNRTAEGVRVTASGLQYKVLRSGPATGLRPQPGDDVKVNYEGSLLTGQVFDSTYERGVPSAMPVNGLIPGWVEALQLMRPGDEWLLWLPPSLGYGDAGAGPIPPGSVLIFRLELIDVLPAPGRIQRG